MDVYVYFPPLHLTRLYIFYLLIFLRFFIWPCKGNSNVLDNLRNVGHVVCTDWTLSSYRHISLHELCKQIFKESRCRLKWFAATACGILHHNQPDLTHFLPPLSTYSPSFSFDLKAEPQMLRLNCFWRFSGKVSKWTATFLEASDDVKASSV